MILVGVLLTAGTAVLATGCTVSFGKENPLKPADTPVAVTNAYNGADARALVPAHTPLDGDVVFAVSTGRVALADPVTDLARIGDAAARTLARAVAIGVHRATVPPGWAGPPAWSAAMKAMPVRPSTSTIIWMKSVQATASMPPSIT